MNISPRGESFNSLLIFNPLRSSEVLSELQRAARQEREVVDLLARGAGVLRKVVLYLGLMPGLGARWRWCVQSRKQKQRW